MKITHRAAIAIALALAIGACGSRSDDDSSTGTDGSTTEATTTTTDIPNHLLRGTLTLTQASALESVGGACGGSGGYSDIGIGTQVKVSDGGGDLLAVGELIDSVRVDIAHCRFRFEVEDVPEVDFYEIEVANRGGITFSLEDMEAMRWEVAVTLG